MGSARPSALSRAWGKGMSFSRAAVFLWWLRMFCVTIGLVAGGLAGMAVGQEFRRLPVSVYRDKMAGGWIGQMAGVAWGGPTEFRWRAQIIPADQMPTWQPQMINDAFGQDDLYVEMTFLRTLEVHGWDVSIRQAGIDFANSEYRLWHANRAGRDNLRSGIAPPDSGHPQFNKHADDIDYQIEADFSGLIAPGMPQLVIELGEKFGRLMNYGDGVYGGQFVGGMYAAAFFESDPVRIVEAGLRCIPQESQYAECIRDVLQWYKEAPDNWEATWQKIEAKYNLNPDYRRYSCSGPKSEFNIDAKINGAYIAMGLLYGKGDFAQTIIIATRCGQDSDCNPSNAAGVLGTVLGRSGISAEYHSALDLSRRFSHTPYTFNDVLAVCEKLARQAVLRVGGKIETSPSGEEIWLIPVREPSPSKLEQCWEPGPIANSRFTEAEMAQIKFPPGEQQ
ncbi:MAG: ADP-ribosylglycohydrolase family protein [Thermoguttaceae bacterium]|nr:ADP-ribosylglycohydrolase family protein [Thermoguttaceae bacterium]MDW8078200.1 ADP-ribosylglycohydrolase family protein [Thermoguttaceae bacterium]